MSYGITDGILIKLRDRIALIVFFFYCVCVCILFSEGWFGKALTLDISRGRSRSRGTYSGVRQSL